MASENPGTYLDALNSYSPLKATNASYVLVGVITAVAILGTTPNFLGASIIGTPALGFLVADQASRQIYRELQRWLKGLAECQGASSQEGGGGKVCPSYGDAMRFIAAYGLVLPIITIYGVQAGLGYFAAKFACSDKLHVVSMLTAALVPTVAMLLWGIVEVVHWSGVLSKVLAGTVPSKSTTTLTSMSTTLRDPLFVFGYLLACSAAATLLVLQHPCPTPSRGQGKAINESLGVLNVPVAPSPQYHHAV